MLYGVHSKHGIQIIFQGGLFSDPNWFNACEASYCHFVGFSVPSPPHYLFLGPLPSIVRFSVPCRLLGHWDTGWGAGAHLPQLCCDLLSSIKNFLKFLSLLGRVSTQISKRVKINFANILKIVQKSRKYLIFGQFLTYLQNWILLSNLRAYTPKLDAKEFS